MLIIADDLSGAADCAVACIGHGLRATVVLGDADGDAHAHVLAIDADTRRLSPKEAAAEIARLLKKHGGDSQLLYKKIDSTLRGPIAAELAAALETLRLQHAGEERIVAVLAPAFPATGRTTIGGRQFLHGKPLEETAIAKSGGMAVRSDMAALIREAHLRPELIALALIRGDRETLLSTMKAKSQQADVLVFDAETDEDLRAIAEASMVLGRGTFWAGSAGLARFLPRAAGLVGDPIPFRCQTFAARPALYVVGSGSPSSREQAEELVAESDTMAIRVRPSILLAGTDSAAWLEHESQLGAALKHRKDVVVLLEAGDELDRRLGEQLTAALGELVRPFSEFVGALVGTGGETARAIFDAWGIHRLQVVGEVETGLPFSITSGWHRELPVLTKAGAFGDAQTFLRCREFLNGLGRELPRNPEQSKGNK
jgi:4-hydroxythreonine-4-phosphate dehydrogenase